MGGMRYAGTIQDLQGGVGEPSLPKQQVPCYTADLESRCTFVSGALPVLTSVLAFCEYRAAISFPGPFSGDSTLSESLARSVPRLRCLL